ncbi:MAG: AAA family ATPase [Phycisphaeraceae bacterium]|nr:AAA family ATPase [Phycisphaeraceae bacterium]
MSLSPLTPEPGDDNARAWEDAGEPVPDTGTAPDPGTINAAEMIREFPELREATIDGLLREGETMNVIAAPKVGKSWLAHSMALSVLTGRAWFEMPTRAGPVLLIDGELHRETLSHRLARTAKQLAINPEQLAQLEVWPLRGRGWDIDTIAAALAEREPGTFRLVVVDALYRFLPTDGEENSNETMTRIYNVLDALANRARASVVVIHHATKGDQSGKSVTDVGAGGGAQSRAADTHLILRQHEEPDAAVVQAVVRSFPPPEPFVLRQCNPGWELAPDLDPSLLHKPPRRNAAKTTAEPAAAPPRELTPEDFARECVGATPIIREDVIAKAKDAGLSKSAAEGLLKRAESAGVVFRVRGSGTEPHRFTTEAQPPLPHSPDSAGGRGEPAATPPPERAAPGGMGGPRDPPPPPTPPAQAAANKSRKVAKTPDKRPGPPAPCYGCKRSRWWSIRGQESKGWTCGACHPPAADDPDVVWHKDAA